MKKGSTYSMADQVHLPHLTLHLEEFLSSSHPITLYISKNMNYEILLQKGFDPIVGSSSSE